MTRYNKKDGFKFKGEPTPCGVGSNYVGGCCAACGAQATSIWLDEDPPVSACDEHKEYIRAGTIELPYARYTSALKTSLGHNHLSIGTPVHSIPGVRLMLDEPT